MKSSITRGLSQLAFLVLLATRPALAADDVRTNSPLDGTWRWEFTMPDSGRITPTLRVKTEDGVLIGTTRFRAGTSTPVTNLTLNGDAVSFEVARGRDRQTTVTRYRGTLFGDRIKGTMVSNWTGREESYDWEATRNTSVDGTWKWSPGFGGRGGPGGRGGGGTTVTLKRDGDKLSGKLNAPRLGEADIKHGRFRNGEVSFQIERERDGETSTNFYRGRFSADTITGRFTSEAGGRVRTNDWRAARAD